MSDSIYRALKGLSRRETILCKQGSRLPKHLEFKLYAFYLSLILIAIVVAFVWQLTRLETFKVTSLIFLLTGYFGIIAHPALLFIVRSKEIRLHFKNPFNLVYSNAQETEKIDKKYIDFLSKKSPEKLEVVLLEVKAQKHIFEQKTALLVGSIERIGFAPGILALLISLDKLSEIELDWVLSIAYIIPIIYFFGAFSRLLASKVSRHISILELAIANQKPHS
ncbi:hypothetical protein [Pseudoalteromonas luteoviolacea]|uniref:Uncharacterized protein n=1 Tax=Pseudoalteromonas luteoviolacea H33 TaxID=1365251 RepID=A0A167ELZ0_9GAMM|nr:hypothetical protein [Pseudoalteromonas luteoviolacea]KZN50940.1 hypothetical protein N476_14960 [Pseudoalteromonas luteoviolacea H33]KZN75014.1 hypothetical protein N477_20600 [Pseudoalteromonas luteoviolacea H33-S]MBQ4879614.1 hypothetical protein [Pseudoalteromonas luteoviolacea]MBQ4909144.1 hypothetical protein [Pseudoalteromonas luteoviolacea]